jgi:hypothetical protein
MYEPADLLERIRLLLIRKRGPKRHADEHRNVAVHLQHATVA